MTGRILALDMGEKRIGLAISDPTGTIARPLETINHVSGVIDAALIAQKAEDLKAVQIVVGIPVNPGENDNPKARHARKFADLLQKQTSAEVVFWDESFSTNQAQEIRRLMSVPKKSRQGHLDDLAAAIILQSYLDSEGQKLP